MRLRGWEGLPDVLRLAVTRHRAGLRAFAAALRRPRGIVLGLAFAVPLASAAAILILAPPGSSPILAVPRLQAMLGAIATAGALGLLWMGASSVTCLSLDRAEATLLLLAPIAWRALVAYRLARVGIACLPVALCVALLPRPASASWIEASIGTLLALVPMFVLPALAHAWLDSRGAGARRAAWFCLSATLVVVALLLPLAAVSDTFRSTDHQSWIALPALPLIRVAAGGGLAPEWPWWLAIAAIDAALLVALVSGRVDPRETFVPRPFATILRGDGGAGMSRTAPASRVAAIVPWLMGAGPFAWRQALILRRRAGYIAGALTLTVAIQAGLILADAGSQVAALSGLVLAGWLLPLVVRADLRSDGAMLRWMRTLPVPASAVALGSLLPVAFATSAVQALALGWMLPAMDAASRAPWIAILLVMPLAHLARLAAASAGWLLRPGASSDGEASTGRAVQLQALGGSVAGVALLPGLVAGCWMWISGLRWIAFAVAAGWCALIAMTALAAVVLLLRPDPA